jgi:hypothetical protein
MVYRLFIDAANACTLMLDDPDWGWLEFYENFFCGASLPQGWNPPRHIFGNKRKKLKDFMYGSNYVPFVSIKAKQVLESCAEGCVDFFYYGKIKGIQYFFMNVIRVEDCLDLNRSDISLLSDGQIGYISGYRFLEKKVPSDCLFKVPEFWFDIFATGSIIECIKQNCLTGVGFDDPVSQNYESIVEGLPIR